MNEMLQTLSFFFAHAAGALFSAIWEGALLAACVLVCLRLLPGLSAAARSVIWLNVFVLLALLHFVPVFAERAIAPAEGRLPAIHLDPRWSLAIAALWLALSLWRAAQLILGIIHLHRLANGAVPVPVSHEIKRLLSNAPGGREAQLCTSGEVARPSVLGFLRPRILVPPALVDALTPAELEQVVLHEMEHLRRADDWTNLLQKIGLVLFPLNPVLLWVERRLCAERELACDDHVVCSAAGRKAYALCLTRLAEFSVLRRSFSLVLGVWDRRPELVRRVHRILCQPVRSMGRKPAFATTSAVLAGALGFTVALSHSPQLVSFVPVDNAQMQLAQTLDPHQVAQALGGTPQLLKAAMPAPSARPAVRQTPNRAQMRTAILKKTARPHKALDYRIASLEKMQAPLPTALPAAALPVLDQRALIVLTEYTAYEASPRVVLAVSRSRTVPAAVPIPATYAIVPTPNGWLIIQI